MTYFVIVLFSAAVWWSKGFYNNLAIWLVVSFLAWVGVQVLRGAPHSPRYGAADVYFYRLYPWVGALMIAFNPNLMYAGATVGATFMIFRFAPVGFNLISGKALPIVALLFFAAVLFLSPNPPIDVFRSNSLGVKFFLHGLDPYSQKYPDIYKGQFDYHPGFLYWPATLCLQALSQVACGDVRGVLVIAWWCGPFFFPRTHPHISALRKIWWFIPFIPFGIEQGWLDPLLSFAAAITLWSMKTKRWPLMALAIAMACSVKQYGFIVGLFPLIALALDRQWGAFVEVGLISFFLFLLVLVPFLIWDFHGFLDMTVNEHVSAASRNDALNFTAFWERFRGTHLPTYAQFGMSLYGFGIAVFHLIKNRARGRLAVISESWAIAFGFSMMFGKFAFCNYYWLLISFLILSLAFEQSCEVEIASSPEVLKLKKQNN